MSCTVTMETGDRTILEKIEKAIRNPYLERKDLAVGLGVSPTGLYAYIRDTFGVCVATMAFLVDTRNGKPIAAIEDSDVSLAGAKATEKHKLKLK